MNDAYLTGANTIKFDSTTEKMQSLYTIGTVASSNFGSYRATVFFNR